MNRTLGIGSLLLVLAVLFVFGDCNDGRRARSAREPCLDLRCFSRGELLPPIENATREEYLLDDGIIANDRVLKTPADEPGLRVAAFDARFALIDYKNFDVAHDPHAVDAFFDFMDGLCEDTVVACTTRGSIAHPEGTPLPRRIRVASQFRKYGARARPFQFDPISWALVTLKRETRWTKLSETWSTCQGVTLAFSVFADFDRYDDYTGDFVRLDEARDVTLSLWNAFPSAHFSDPTVQQRPQLILNQVLLPILAMNLSDAKAGKTVRENASKQRPRNERESRVAWKPVSLGGGPRFTCRLGYASLMDDPCRALIFSVYVDGRPFAEKRVELPGGMAKDWIPWEVDLAPFRECRISLELRVRAEGKGANLFGFWGDPRLSWQSDCDYAFFVAGHAYGDPYGDRLGLHPPFARDLDRVRDDPSMKMGFFTGDIVRHSTSTAWDEVDKTIRTLNMPVYFAAGNHDLMDLQGGKLYTSRYGKTYYGFRSDNDLFIVLDPNMDGWSISGEQLEWLKRALEERGRVKHIFVFSHQVMWLDFDPHFRTFIPNSLAGRAEEVNFHSEVKPLFENLGVPVYFFAGDMGAHEQPPSVLYHTEGALHFIGSGMGSGKKDNYLIVRVLYDGSVDIKVVALNGDDPHAMGFIEDHPAPAR